MSTIKKSISQVLKDALKTFKIYPASMASALGFALVTIVRIHIDWPSQEKYNFLFNSLHLSLALGAIFSLAAVAIANSKYNDKKAFNLANILGAIIVVLSFLLLYFFGGSNHYLDPPRIIRVTDIAAARVSVAIFISMIIFIIIGGHPKDKSDFSRSLFMTHKAFIIAFIYGIAMIAGASGVAAAIQALLYRNMSYDVYMYISTIGGFLAYAIFVGYFPDFRKGSKDEKRDIAQKQAKFIEILFQYIMVPITLALTVVLLLWSIKTLIVREEISFVRLSSIATSYAIIGIWLHLMVTHSVSQIAVFYRKVYPYTALIILAFEARALLIQLNNWGLKTTEYIFIIIWIVNVAAALLLIRNKDKNHERIALITILTAIVAIMPITGYHTLPVKSQINRLEKILIKEGVLVDGSLIPLTNEIDKTIKEKITESIDYLAYKQNAKLPLWFDRDLRNSNTFKEKLGFEKTWPDFEPDAGLYKGIYLSLPAQAIDISNYQWVANMQYKGESLITVVGEKGVYQVYWDTDRIDGIPEVKIELEDKIIVEKDIKEYLDQITGKYPPGEGKNIEASLEDMILKLEYPEINVMLVFNSISINVDIERDKINYWANLEDIYIREN